MKNRWRHPPVSFSMISWFARNVWGEGKGKARRTMLVVKTLKIVSKELVNSTWN